MLTGYETVMRTLEDESDCETDTQSESIMPSKLPSN